VIFLDSDDLWEADALETLVGALDAHPEYVSSHCLARCIDRSGRPLAGDDLVRRSRERKGYKGGHLVSADPTAPTAFGDLAYHNWVLTPGTQLIRRTIATRVGDFDPATDPADDWDLAVRVSRQGDIAFVDRPLLLWRRHDNTLTNTSPRWGRAYLRVRNKMLTDRSNTADQTRSARLAYVNTALSTWREAREALARRAYREVVRQTAKALHQYQTYLRANVPVRIDQLLRRG
jgi:hypothetical protein